MQFLRNSLSLSFISNPQNQAQPATNGTTENGGTSGVPRRGDDEGKHPSPSPSVSTVSERTKYATVRSKVPLDLGSPPSAYSTPFQSPIITSRTFPVLSDAARALNDNGSNDTSNDGTGERGQERPSKVYFIEQGQLQTSYELPERPGNRGTRAADSGFVNSAFTNDSGATMINMSSTQPRFVNGYRSENQSRVQPTVMRNLATVIVTTSTQHSNPATSGLAHCNATIRIVIVPKAIKTAIRLK
uniref:Uncharacterized protein n=1 Tax=Anopheles atroparvus TaxID=41427 RepID=A0AAG5CV56_ANOAO